MVARYTHAHQFKRTRRELKFLRTRLGRVIRDIRVRSPATTASSNASRSFSLWPIGYASSITASARGLCATRPRGRMHRQEQGADGVRVRLRSIGRHPGHQRRPVCLHAKALYGNGSAATRWDRSSPSLSSRPALRPAVIHVDKRYRGHNHKQKFRVWIGGQVRRGTKPIGREMRRRAAVEAVIGHAKAEHRMGIWRRATAIGSMPCSWLQGIFPPPPALAGKVFCAIYSRRSSHQSRTPNHPETAARRFFPHSLIIQDLPNLGRKI
jgi:IS5 family transposase